MRLIDWVAETFAVDFDGGSGMEKGVQWGAEVLSEQRDDMAKMGSHTSRFASVLALYASMTGDAASAERAWRSLSWASYTCSAEGVVKVGTNDGEGYWFSDGYGDYLRHFLSAMAARPEWAPAGENHLLRSSAVIRRAVYAPGQVRYEASEPQGEELLKVSAAPVSVTCDGQAAARDAPAASYSLRALDGGGYALTITRNACAGVLIRLR